MKIWIAVLTFSAFLSSFVPLNRSAVSGCYSSDFVDITTVKHQNETYSMVVMRRDGDRVKAKYFAAKDYNGSTVYNRYLTWKNNNPGVILLSSGTYTDNYDNAQGLTIDNGVVVNESLICDKMDALVIVYASGGIAVSDLRVGGLSVSGIPRKLNLCSSSTDLDDFIEWAKEEGATVFQTHLLAYKNEVKVKRATSSKTVRERRFLAVGKDESGKYVHVIVHNPDQTTLYDGTEKVLRFLREFKDMDVTFMINLDTGAQDVFELHNPDCSVNSTIKGQKPPSAAVNILAYYFK
ncbi:MAG: hypothetical protein ABMA02_18935 [Saprospiraceae bacterium]